MQAGLVYIHLVCPIQGWRGQEEAGAIMVKATVQLAIPRKWWVEHSLPGGDYPVQKRPLPMMQQQQRRGIQTAQEVIFLML